MPISSGATVKDGNENSYLKRYFRTLPEEKRNMIEKSLMNAKNDQASVCDPKEGRVDVTAQVPEPGKGDIQNINSNDGEDSEGRGPIKPSSKKSSTCIML